MMDVAGKEAAARVGWLCIFSPLDAFWGTYKAMDHRALRPG